MFNEYGFNEVGFNEDSVTQVKQTPAPPQITPLRRFGKPYGATKVIHDPAFNVYKDSQCTELDDLNLVQGINDRYLKNESETDFHCDIVATNATLSFDGVDYGNKITAHFDVNEVKNYKVNVFNPNLAISIKIIPRKGVV